jgi:hypothetical protein
MVAERAVRRAWTIFLMLVRGLGDPRADDEPEPGVLQRVQVRRREHSGVSDHDHVSHAMALRERAQHRDQGGGLGLVALEQVHLERESAGVCQEPDLDLRVDSVLLGYPDLAQFVGSMSDLSELA